MTEKDRQLKQMLNLFKDKIQYSDEQLHAMKKAYRQLIEYADETGRECNPKVYIAAQAIDKTLELRQM